MALERPVEPCYITLKMPAAQPLANLEASGLIRLAQVEPDLEYLFRHALIHEAAYQTLLRTEKRELHRAVGETLERLFGARLDEMSATLAFHFARAEAHEPALRYFARSADRAKAVFANTEAIAAYQAAIRHAGQLPDSQPHSPELATQLHEHLGEVLELVGRLEEAETAYAAALGLAAPGHTVLRARLERKIGRTYVFRFRYGEAAAALDRAMQTLSADPNEPETLWWQEWIAIQLQRMEMRYYEGDWRDVAGLVEQTQPVLERYGTPALRVYFYDSLLSVEKRRERYIVSEAMLQAVRSMIAAARESGDLRLMGNAEFELGFTHLIHDDFAEAEAHLLAAEAMNRRIGNELFLTFGLTYQSVLYRRRGEREAARRYTLAALAAAQANGVAVHQAVAAGNLAWLAWHERQLTEVYRHGQTATELWAQSAFVYPLQWTALLPLLAADSATAHIADAVQHARTLTAPSQQRLPEPVDGPLTKAVQCFDCGRLEDAVVQLRQAVEAAERLRYL